VLCRDGTVLLSIRLAAAARLKDSKNAASRGSASLAAGKEPTKSGPLRWRQQGYRSAPRRFSLQEGASVTDGMKALFVVRSDLLAKPYDINQLSAKVAEMAAGE
jgi:hypothetical protein